MSEGSGAARSKRQAAAGGSDRLGALPDGLLQDILSFLPSPAVVRTCVLAHGVPALRITRDVARRYWGPTALNGFVNHLLFLRERSPLRVAEFNTKDGGDFDEAVRYLELWVRYSLSCQVAKLRVACDDELERWLLPKGLITFEHLTTLELILVMSEHDVDFSSCVSLQDLKMECSSICCNRIASPSLKRLRISECRFLGDVRTQISAPNLISLLLDSCTQRTPLLESMPVLEEAVVSLQNCSDFCRNGYEVGDCGDESCWGCQDSNYGKNTCVLLQGLSSCTNLELISATAPTKPTSSFIFRKDLTQCPVFSKLKTLLLDDWCITTNHGALICFLQHSPVLEKLILHFSKTHGNLVEMGASYDLRKQPLALKDLSEVQFDEGDERVLKVLDVLCSYGLPPEKIKIQYPLELIGI
ncbi:F-box/FBD/LRR-repeat protein At5g56420-like [Panicum hallii]|nr:F-box/FBD/LRR-repeat protein At5g56420-like [Panicum hallii]